MNLCAELPVDFFIRSEYKKDTVDYSNTTKYYYREKLSILFSMESALNLSCIYLEQEKNYKYTWNIVLNDISPNFYLIAGNYFTHFGSGLLIGRKRTYDPDIYSFRTTESSTKNYKSSFTPCSTGNPVFAFHGMGTAFILQTTETRLALNAFYSIKERFISEDSYDSNKISGTADTLDSKIKREYNHSEPVEIHTGGAMLSAEIFSCILLEAYYLNADIQSRYKGEILWEYGEDSNGSSGISELNGFGFFSQYKDEFFSFLIDGVITQKESVSDNGRRKTEYGRGLLYKLKFAPPFLQILFAGKEVGEEFYSPYSSSIGEDHPESAWFLDTEIKPYTNFKLNSKLSSQKKTAASSADDAAPVIKKEIISLKYSYGRLEEVEIAVKRREKTDEEKTITKQLHPSIDVGITNSLKINLSCAYHWINNNDLSKIYLAGLQFVPVKPVKINLSFLSASITENNYFYAVVSPLRDSSTQGFYIKHDSCAVVIKSEIKIKEIFISCRYFYQFNKNRQLHTRLEFFASGCF
ncbi:MAG: hypothetical protein JXN64_10350 [Spirochaetes bacterium]|nr:hypothetical protein [Spirochaetota bacterium]